MFFLFRNGKLLHGGSLTTGKSCFSTQWLIACFLTAAPRKLLTNLVIFWGFLPPRDSTVRKKAPDMSRGLYSGLWEVFGSKYYIYKFKCFLSYELAVTIWMSVPLFLKCLACLSSINRDISFFFFLLSQLVGISCLRTLHSSYAQACTLQIHWW